MHNRHMERSAAYAGILGALIFIASGVILGSVPDINSSSATLAASIDAHHMSLLLSAWLALPASAFILWFAYGLFDYLWEPTGANRTLLQWGSAGVVIWTALFVVSSALQAALTISPGTDISTLYVFTTVLFVFGMGAFAILAFAVANAARRNGALPGWLNALGFLVFAVDLLYTLTLFAPGGALSMTGFGVIVAPFLSAVWILAASFVLLASVPKTSSP